MIIKNNYDNNIHMDILPLELGGLGESSYLLSLILVSVDAIIYNYYFIFYKIINILIEI